MDHPNDNSPAAATVPTATISPESRQLAELMETLVKENRAHMADFVEAMRLRDEFSTRIGRRTTQIIRFSAAALVVMGTGMMVLILTLILHMNEITHRMDDMTGHMASMRNDFSQVAGNVNNMDNKISMINSQFSVLTGQMNYMTRDLNTMSSPMRLMPFRP